jgi:SAM-dependent methyltransferase
VTKYLHSEVVHNTEAAKIILPVVFEYLNPNSILDLGCGIGTWLNVAKGLGIKDIHGVDGEYVDKNLLTKYISASEFTSADLTKSLSLDRGFDLCFCLEVAEHLPKESAKSIVETLVNHSDVILFSAAIPGQGGQNHLNEQYPTYWAKLFSEYDFAFYDLIRPLIWENEKIEFWYKQNIFIVAKKGVLDLPATLEKNLLKIHPEMVLSNSFELTRVKLELEKRSKDLFQINHGEKSLNYYFKLLIKYFIK